MPLHAIEAILKVFDTKSLLAMPKSTNTKCTTKILKAERKPYIYFVDLRNEKRKKKNPESPSSAHKMHIYKRKKQKRP
jgi:hypothetical protein